MNFRELLIERVFNQLKVLTEDITSTPIAGGGTQLTPNPLYTGVILKLDYGPLEKENPDLTGGPRAYVSWDGGRHDLAEDTFLSHVVETLGIRVEVLLDKNIGIHDPPNLDADDTKDDLPIRGIEFQVGDLLGDMDHLINHASMGSALNGLDDYTVQDVVMEEWELDERFRGGPKEVLSIVFQVQVANPKNPTPSG